MFITELFEAEQRNLVVVYAGRFQPFHKGHKAVYDHLLKNYGRDHVWIATSNKVEPPKSPFNFTDKCYFMQMQGIPMDRVVESTQPYKATELTSHYDADKTVFLIAVSEKDMAEDPRFKVGYKKDGNPTYFQNLPKDLKQAEPMSKHGYLVIVPTVDFKVLGQPMRSATEIRALYGKSDEATRKSIIADLFGTYTQEAEQIMNNKLQEDSNMPVAVDSTSPIHGGTVQEGASGYIPKNSKEAKDPRWERALSVDVRPDTMKKEIAAFFPTKAPKTQQKQVTENEDPNDLSKLRSNIEELTWRQMETLREEIVYYKNLLASQKDASPELKAAWNRKIDKLQDNLQKLLKIK